MTTTAEATANQDDSATLLAGCATELAAVNQSVEYAIALCKRNRCAEL